MRKKSKVWRYFTKNAMELNASCMICAEKISCSHGNTSTMRRHLLSKHQIDVDKIKLKKKQTSVKVTENVLIEINEQVEGNIAHVEGPKDYRIVDNLK